jgi:hypothetical protein
MLMYKLAFQKKNLITGHKLNVKGLLMRMIPDHVIVSDKILLHGSESYDIANVLSFCMEQNGPSYLSR